MIGSHGIVGALTWKLYKGEDKLPFENDQYDMLETWNTICDLVKKGNVVRSQKWPSKTVVKFYVKAAQK